MLNQLMVFFALATALSTALLLLPGAVRARWWAGMPLAIAALTASGWLTGLLTGDFVAGAFLASITAPLTLVAHAIQRRWSTLASQVFATLLVACAAYILYAGWITLELVVSPAWMVASFLLLLLETAALALTVSYAFEVLDVLSRRDEKPPPLPDALAHSPMVALQVATYNEPVEIVGETLRSLAAMDYPNFMVQVVDNNTTDPAVWRPLEQLCKELGPRFSFIHLENWPGYKSGALNEATRRLPPEVELLGVIDADYLVEPDFLRRAAPHFADTAVAFVQTPQNYRDWEDDRYLRGLFYSYRYFFEITMPARAHRNAIIFCGTMGILRRRALEEIGGWSEVCITEDAEASLRILGRGYRGVYLPEPSGAGMMPLDFDGLKKQRYRWSLGGVQILRMHWRELLPFAPHRLRLTRAQRVHYLLGSVQWFGEVLTLGFTLMLLATATSVVVGHRFPIRPLTGALMLVPLAFLASGVLRALWALRVTARCTWADSIRALRVWFALSWVVTIACTNGLVREKAQFLRTPKRKEDSATFVRALSSAKTEAAIGLLALGAAAVMLVASPSLTIGGLALMLAFEGAVYLSAPWAGAAAEGIQMTPLREVFRRSAQNTGERPTWAQRAIFAVPAGAAALVAGGALASLLAVAPTPPPVQPGAGLPGIGQGLGHVAPGLKPVINSAQETLGAATKAVPSPAANLLIAPSPSPSAVVSASPAPATSPSPGASATPSP